MSTILAIETSSVFPSVSIYSNGVVYYSSADEKNVHSEALVSLIQSVLDDANVSLADIDFVCCSVGPGSFTGIRSGISFAQGMASSIDRPLYGFSSLQIVSVASDSISGWASVKAGKGNFYAQEFHNHLPLGEIETLNEEEFEKLKTGIGIINFDIKSDVLIQPNAKIICELINKLDRKNLDKYQVKPLYVKPPEAEITLRNKKDINK